MFLDVSLMVSQQGEYIGRVSEYVEHTAGYTTAAAETMRKTVVTKRGVQRKKWILIAILIAAIVAIAIILGVTLGVGR